jgi:hypothetical protein
LFVTNKRLEQGCISNEVFWFKRVEQAFRLCLYSEAWWFKRVEQAFRPAVSCK